MQFARGKVSPSLTEGIFEDTSSSPSAYALALYSGLWAIDGWDQANYVAGEMRDAAKDIPRAIHTSMFVVLVSVMIRTLLHHLNQISVAVHVHEHCVFRSS